EAEAGADGHAAIEAEVDHAGSLDDDLAERCVEDAGARPDAPGRDTLEERRAHAVAPPGRPRRARTQKSVSAMSRLTLAKGRPWLSWSESAPAVRTARRKVMTTRPIGLCRASQLARKPM